MIDIHMHIGYHHNRFYNPELVVDVMKKASIQFALVSSLTSIYDPRRAQEELVNVSSNFSDKLGILYWLNPYLFDWQPQITKFMKQHKIYGIKLHPTANIYDFHLIFLQDVLNFADKYSLPLFIHTDSYRSQPLNLVESIIQYPNISFVLYHMDDPINSILMAKRFSNVYLETSLIEHDWPNLAPVKIAVDVIGDDRILFGSDFPFGFTVDSGTSESLRDFSKIRELYEACFSSDTVDKIFHNNAKKLLNL